MKTNSSIRQFFSAPPKTADSKAGSVLVQRSLCTDDTLTKAMPMKLMFPDSRIAADKFMTVTKLILIVLSNQLRNLFVD